MSLNAYMTTDCELGCGYIAIGCHNTYTGRGIRDLVLSSSSACSTFWSNVGADVNGTITLYSLQNESGPRGRDATCTGSQDRLSGSFAVTKH